MSARQAVVTGAFSFTGRFIARELLARGWSVRTLTNAKYPGDPLDGLVEVAPLRFDDLAALRTAMTGADAFINTYWIRNEHVGTTFAQAVENTRTLLDAASDAAVGRVIQIGVAGARAGSPHPYIAFKWRADEVLRESGLEHAVVQPTLIFGEGDVLITNMAWLLRRSPAFFLVDGGHYPVQPVAGEDVARVSVDLLEQPVALTGQVVDVGGPDTMPFADFIRMIRNAVGARCALIPTPQSAVLAVSALLRPLIGERVVTEDELIALRAGTLASSTITPGAASFAHWLALHADTLGRRYVGRHTRHAYQPR